MRAARPLPRSPVGDTVAFTLLSGSNAQVTVLSHVRSSVCSTVYRGRLGYGTHVAIKAPKGSAIATDLITRELRSWRSVQHPYILPLLGFNDSNGDDPLLLITPWMDNGNLCAYLRLNPGADRPRLVHQIAEGLSYLHMIAKIVHGDLKGEDILVSHTGDPLVADFGLSTLTEKTDDDATTESVIRQLSTFVFSAPELLTDEVYQLDAATSSHGLQEPSSQRRKRSKSVKTDVFAFGMVIIEIFTGVLPWSHVRDKKRLFVNLLFGTYSHPHPGAEALSLGFNEALWHICQLCWAFDPCHRPNMDHIATIMRYQSTNPRLPEPWTVEGAWESSMGQLRWVPRPVTPAEPPALVPPCRAESCSPRMLASRRDPRATLAWRDAQEADFLRSGRRRRRPGVTFDVPGEDMSLSRALLSPRIVPRNISSRSSVRSPTLRRSVRTAAYDLDGHDADVE